MYTTLTSNFINLCSMNHIKTTPTDKNELIFIDDILSTCDNCRELIYNRINSASYGLYQLTRKGFHDKYSRNVTYIAEDKDGLENYKTVMELHQLKTELDEPEEYTIDFLTKCFEQKVGDCGEMSLMTALLINKQTKGADLAPFVL